MRTLARDTPRRRATPALARRAVGKGYTMQLMGMHPCTVPAEMILAIAEIAKEVPAYSALAIAPRGRIWATRYVVPGDAAFADVYEERSGYVGTVPLGAARPVAFFADGRMISLEQDADGVPQIVVYEVRRE